MARVAADAEMARTLAAPGRLRRHLPGNPDARPGRVHRGHPRAGRAGRDRRGVPVEVLGDGHRTARCTFPGTARCAAPLRSVLAGSSFAPPRRRLVSTITGHLVTLEDDILFRMLADQVTRPVLFARR